MKSSETTRICLRCIQISRSENCWKWKLSHTSNKIKMSYKSTMGPTLPWPKTESAEEMRSIRIHFHICTGTQRFDCREGFFKCFLSVWPSFSSFRESQVVARRLTLRCINTNFAEPMCCSRTDPRLPPPARRVDVAFLKSLPADAFTHAASNTPSLKLYSPIYYNKILWCSPFGPRCTWLEMPIACPAPCAP